MKFGLRGVACLLLSTKLSPDLIRVVAHASSTSTASAALSQSTLPVGSCTAEIVTYGDSFCKTVAAGGPCTSNCDAKAQFGFCGTTDEFCGTGCMSNCNPAQPASCAANQQSALQRRIGYYEGWASSRSCDSYTPSAMDVDVLTHVNFAFAYISDSFEVVEMTSGDSKLWTETTALKSRNPALKVFLSIGGWTFNNPPTAGIFSALAASSANTNKFIKSVLNVMNAYGFDGIDIEDRGGSANDKVNYPTFLKAVKKAFTPYGYELSFTAPSSYWYLQNYDLPNLLADGAADWVNVMTYDLHVRLPALWGVWDSPADYIGSIVLAHTNLTQIMMTFQLYANVGIDPSKIVMGLGFYGRSFQLSSASCTDPGCPFAGAAPAGPCSANAGTLMFAEIEDIISSVGSDQLVFDEAAAVKYLVYDNNNWVSYDDQQTLDMKLQYANGICLSGTMVWSLDQLSGETWQLILHPHLLPENISGDSCTYTGCGLICPKDTTILGKLQQNPITLEPVGDAPQSCTWRGYSPSGQCNGTCLDGEIVMGLSKIGDTPGAVHVPGVTLRYAANQAKRQGITVRQLTVVSLRVLQARQRLRPFSRVRIWSFAPRASTRPCAAKITSASPTANSTALYQIAWTVPAQSVKPSYSATTRAMQVLRVLAVINVTTAAIHPIDAKFSPVNVGDVFPESETMRNAVTFAVDYDDNQGTTADTFTGDGSSGLSDDGKENDSPFSSVFISSPNAASVSSLDLDSDWALTDCDATSDEAQSVLAYCTCPMAEEDCGCGHVFIGGAADTIVKLPSSCGLGPYARVVSLEVHPDQTALSGKRAGKRSADPVYSLAFDYAFTDISVDKGPIYMRADMTDMPGYWDSIIDSPPDATSSVRKRDLNFHQPRGLEKRWFGSFKAWLSKLNTLTTSDSISRNYHWSDTYTIFHQEEVCLAAFVVITEIDLPLVLSELPEQPGHQFASINSQFGYYLEATVVPPAVQQAYVYFKAGISVTSVRKDHRKASISSLHFYGKLKPHKAAFTITGIASASWNSGRYELVNFGFPGLYYPGLLTLGPSLHLYGELSGQLSLAGTYKTAVSYTFPNLDLSFGKQDADAGVSNFGSPVAPTNHFSGFDSSVGWNVELSGTADVHLIPSLQLGVSVLGGSLIDAQVFVEADLFAGLSITGSVSKAVALDACITPDIGVSLSAGLTGSVLYWQTGPLSTIFYTATSTLEPSCLNSVTEPPGGSGGTSSVVDENRIISRPGSTGRNRSPERRNTSEPAYAVALDGRTIHPTGRWEREGLRGDTPDLNKRDIPFLPGNLFCPATDSDIGSTATNCDPYAGDSNALSQRDVLDEHLFAREAHSVPLSNETRRRNDHAAEVHRLSKLPIAVFDSLKVNAYYDLASPAILDGAIHAYANMPPYYSVKTLRSSNGAPAMIAATNPGQQTSAIPGAKHVAIPASLFIDYLHQFPEVWTDGSNNSFCEWVNNNLWEVPAYMPVGSRPVIEQIGLCYPSLANSRSAGIPVLEQIANVYKNSAFYVTEKILDPGILTVASGIVKEDDFKGDCPTAQVAALRTLAMITPFMNTWYTAYAANTPNAVPAPAIFVGEYNSWVKQIVEGVQNAVTSQMDTLIPLYNNGDTRAVAVKLSTNPVLSVWAKLTPRVPAGTPWVPTTNLRASYSLGVDPAVNAKEHGEPVQFTDPHQSHHIQHTSHFL
ncbi:hypothetical protein B0H16DRAFT_1455758 [Mycena metata]|uniref:GH18 domain-containing protein n=1 Tax=Mycena metata TaxID=1033252 RepID=A0AAD7JCR0_9AGAR|nr:hypothetical protein B0H16DRAFT_1455758 [Mycena metata]